MVSCFKLSYPRVVNLLLTKCPWMAYLVSLKLLLLFWLVYSTLDICRHQLMNTLAGKDTAKITNMLLFCLTESDYHLHCILRILLTQCSVHRHTLLWSGQQLSWWHNGTQASQVHHTDRHTMYSSFLLLLSAIPLQWLDSHRPSVP